MNFGKLDRKIKIYTPSRVKNDYGEDVIDSTSYIEVWAQITPKASGSGTEFEADQFTRVENVDIFIRYSNNTKGIGSNNYIEYDSKFYSINSVQEIGRGAGLKLECEIKQTNNTIS